METTMMGYIRITLGVYWDFRGLGFEVIIL